METKVELNDESAGLFVDVSQTWDGAGKIRITPEEWPVLREAIDRMIAACSPEAGAAKPRDYVTPWGKVMYVPATPDPKLEDYGLEMATFYNNTLHVCPTTDTAGPDPELHEDSDMSDSNHLTIFLLVRRVSGPAGHGDSGREYFTLATDSEGWSLGRPFSAFSTRESAEEHRRSFDKYDFYQILELPVQSITDTDAPDPEGPDSPP